MEVSMNSTPRLYARRWPILIAFCLINAAIQILWICYAPVADLAAKEYGVQRWWIDFLPMLFMLVYLPFSIPASWAIDTWGFSRSVGRSSRPAIRISSGSTSWPTFDIARTVTALPGDSGLHGRVVLVMCVSGFQCRRRTVLCGRRPAVHFPAIPC